MDVYHVIPTFHLKKKEMYQPQISHFSLLNEQIPGTAVFFWAGQGTMT